MIKISLFAIFLLIVKSSYSQSSSVSFHIQKDATYLLDSAKSNEILKSLDQFLKSKDSDRDLLTNPKSLKENVEPFFWLNNFERENKGEKSYQPTLLAVVPLKGDDYLVKISFLGTNNDGSKEHLLTYTLIINNINGKYLFSNSVNYNAQNWNTQQIGSIKYIFPNKLNLAKAKELNEFNISFAKKFNSPIVQFTYYKCYDPEQLFKLLGCDYIPNMYYSTSGGLAESWHNTLLAGNNSELYQHEVVHFYTHKFFPQYNRIVDEGYATYIGGSGGKNTKELSAIADEYLKANPKSDIIKLFTNFSRVQGGIPFTYIVSALVCKEIESKKGFESILQLFKLTKDEDSYFQQIENIMHIDKDSFPNYVKSLINKYK